MIRADKNGLPVPPAVRDLVAAHPADVAYAQWFCMQTGTLHPIRRSVWFGEL